MTALSYPAWIRNPSGCMEEKSPLAVASTWPHDAFHSQHAGQAGRGIQLSARLCLFLGQLSPIVCRLSPWPVMPDKSVTQEELKMVRAIPESGRLLAAAPLLLLSSTRASPSTDRMLSQQVVSISFTNTGSLSTAWKNGYPLSLLGWQHRPVVIPSCLSALKSSCSHVAETDCPRCFHFFSRTPPVFAHIKDACVTLMQFPNIFVSSNSSCKHHSKHHSNHVASHTLIHDSYPT